MIQLAGYVCEWMCMFTLSWTMLSKMNISAKIKNRGSKILNSGSLARSGSGRMSVDKGSSPGGSKTATARTSNGSATQLAATSSSSSSTAGGEPRHQYDQSSVKSGIGSGASTRKGTPKTPVKGEIWKKNPSIDSGKGSEGAANDSQTRQLSDVNESF